MKTRDGSSGATTSDRTLPPNGPVTSHRRTSWARSVPPAKARLLARDTSTAIAANLVVFSMNTLSPRLKGSLAKLYHRGQGSGVRVQGRPKTRVLFFPDP